MAWVIEMPLKLPSLNDYVLACRTNKYKAARMKKENEALIAIFINKLPRFNKPIKIHFHWVEGNKRRDYDNVAFAKKFILDALVKRGKLLDDSRNYVIGFTDTFEHGKAFRVIIEITEV